MLETDIYIILNTKNLIDNPFAFLHLISFMFRMIRLKFKRKSERERQQKGIRCRRLATLFR
uniref:Uncharacterized protein n=1 Tax=Helianthus annuus TaxID=4232 RepID=A0A251SW82_HELAN